MTQNAFIVARDLGRDYKGIQALGSVSVTFDHPEVIGLAGPNGAGKSTFSQIVAGFIRPSRGSVTVAGLSPVEFRSTRGIGYLPEALPRPWRCTVTELLELRLNTVDQFSPRALLAMLKLEHLASRKLRALSNGEWRRVVSAFAFSGAPPLVVLDEPDSGLDPAAVTRLVNLIKLARNQGMTCLVLSHQLTLLEEACDRIGFIDRGQLKAMLPIAEVRSRGARNLYRELLEEDYVSEPVEL